MGNNRLDGGADDDDGGSGGGVDVDVEMDAFILGLVCRLVRLVLLMVLIVADGVGLGVGSNVLRGVVVDAGDGDLACFEPLDFGLDGFVGGLEEP